MNNRILIFIDYYLPGFKAGGPIKTVSNSINYLCKTYEFYILTRNHDLNDKFTYDIETGKWIKNDEYTIMYLGQNEFRVKTLKKIIAEVNPFCFYINSFFSFKLSIKIVLFCIPRISKIILAPRGELSNSAISNKKTIKTLYLFYSVLFQKYKGLIFQASNDEERNDINKYFPKNKIIIIPDPIDNINGSKTSSYIKYTNYLKLCFISRITPIKNLKFCFELLNSIELISENIYLDIYGPIENEHYWKECMKIQNNRINYCGELIPALVKDTFCKYDFFFFPSESENFGHVIFESLSVGTPVILSNNTLWHSIEGFEKHSFAINTINVTDYIMLFKKLLKIDATEYSILSNEAYNFSLKYHHEQKDKGEIHQLFNFSKQL